MEYRIESAGKEITVVFQGDITFSENVTFRRMLAEVSENKPESCVFDLSTVGMVDSAGLGMFLIAREQAETSGWAMKVKGAKGNVASMLKLTKLSEYFETE